MRGRKSMYNKNEILSALNEIKLDDYMELSKIPDIDLYMDQIITLFDKNLGDNKRNEEDKLLTKTMINNYAKDKLLMAPDKKKYTKEHIILMCIIYNLKQSLSIQDIKKLFNPMIANFEDEDLKEDEKEKLSKLYESFYEIKKNEIDYNLKNIEEKINNINNMESDDYGKVFITVLILIYSANIQRKLAERMIDKFLKFENDEK